MGFTVYLRLVFTYFSGWNQVKAPRLVIVVVWDGRKMGWFKRKAAAPPVSAQTSGNPVGRWLSHVILGELIQLSSFLVWFITVYHDQIGYS